MAGRPHSWLRQTQARGATPRIWPWRHRGDRCTLGPGCPRRRGLADHPSTTRSLHRAAQPSAPQFPTPSPCRRRPLPRHLATVSTVGARLAPAPRAPPCPLRRAGIAPLNPPAPRLQAALASPARRRAGPLSLAAPRSAPQRRPIRARSCRPRAEGAGSRREREEAAREGPCGWARTHHAPGARRQTG